VGAVILVTACFPIESRWITRRSDVRIVHTAMGNASAVSLDELGDAASDAALLIATGFAGGIDPSIERADLTLARTVRHRGEEIEIDAQLVDRARRALADRADALHVGTCESADRVLGTDEKRDLAAGGVISVDMESGPLARWAAARGIPFLVLRVVLDPAGDELPFSDDRPFWTSVLRHPVSSLRTARHAATAGRALGRAVDTVVDALTGGRDA